MISTAQKSKPHWNFKNHKSSLEACVCIDSKDVNYHSQDDIKTLRYEDSIKSAAPLSKHISYGAEKICSID